MTDLQKSKQIEDEVSICKKNHIAMATGLCLIPLIPALFCIIIRQFGEQSSDSRTLEFVFWGICLLVFGVGLWEAFDLIFHKGVSSCCKKGFVAVATGLYLIPWSMPLAFFILGPGFVTPFFNHLNVVLILIATILWQAIGFILLTRAKSSIQSFLIMLFFILPASLMIALGPLIVPALITMVQGFCQISNNAR